jgi:hypothetical protein
MAEPKIRRRLYSQARKTTAISAPTNTNAQSRIKKIVANRYRTPWGRPAPEDSRKNCFVQNFVTTSALSAAKSDAAVRRLKRRCRDADQICIPVFSEYNHFFSSKSKFPPFLILKTLTASGMSPVISSWSST